MQKPYPAQIDNYTFEHRKHACRYKGNLRSRLKEFTERSICSARLIYRIKLPEQHTRRSRQAMKASLFQPLSLPYSREIYSSRKPHYRALSFDRALLSLFPAENYEALTRATHPTTAKPRRRAPGACAVKNTAACVSSSRQGVLRS